MKSSFYVTLQKTNDNTSIHIISPEYRDIEDAATFLSEVISRLDGDDSFKMLDDAGLAYQDQDYTFQVVEQPAYWGIPLVQFNMDTFETCFTDICHFLQEELVGQE